MSQYFLPRVPGVPPATVELSSPSPTERRGRAVGLVVLGVTVVAAAAGVGAVALGALPPAVLAAALAVGLGLSLVSALVVDLVATLRQPARPRSGVRPGLRAASFLYLSALVCLVTTFAFLAS